MWCHLPAGFSRLLSLRIVVIASLLVALITTYSFTSTVAAVTGINKTINFQGRLLNAQGATVADGYYNIQFKVYQDGDGQTAGNTTGSPVGTLEWTETYINNGSATGAIQVKNGFFAVNLGSLNPFGTSVDWNQDTIYLSMNVAGSAVACTTFGTAPCAADGEMLPMRRLTASPYALNSGQLNGLSSANFVQLAQGVQTDASTNTSSVFINKTSTGNLIQLQNTATDVFTIGNTGNLTFGSNADHTLSVGTSAASTVGRSLTMAAGGGGSGTGSVGGDLLLQGGAAGGTNANGGNLILDAGAKTGSGTAGSINIGTANAGTIQIGSTTLATGTQTINIGTNNTAGNTTNVTIGSGSSATAGATSIQSKGNTTITTNGVTRATFNTTGSMFVGDGITSSSTGTFAIQGSTGAASNTGYLLIVQGGSGGSGTGSTGGQVNLRGGSGGGTNGGAGNLSLDAGTITGTGTRGIIGIGNANASAVNIGQSTSVVTAISIGSTGLTTGTQTITIGNLAAAGTQNIVIGAASGAGGGTTAIQSKGNSTLATNGTTRATFDTSGNLFVGDGTTSTSTGTFTIQGSTGAASNTGYAMVLQGGAGGSGTGSAGGAVTIQGGGGGGTNGAGGNLTIDTGAITGSGTRGTLSVGTTNAGAVGIGNTNAAITIQGNGTASAVSIQSAASGTIAIGTANAANTVTVGNIANAVAQTINLGYNNTASSTTNVNIGNLLSTSATLIQGGTGSTAVRINSGAAGTIGIATANAANTVQIGNTANGIAQTFGIGNNATASSTSAITMGNLLGTSSTVIQGGTGAGAVSIQSGAAGTISIGTSNVANTVTIGNTANAVAQTVNLGYNNTASSTTNVNIGNLLSTSSTTIQGGTGASAVNINSGAAGTINVATSNAANTVTIGNISNAVAQTFNLGFNATASSTSNVNIGNLLSTSATVIQGGTSATAVRINSGAGGTIGIGTANAANTIQIGNNANAVAQTIGIGNNATASSTTNVTVGNLLSTSSTTIQGGTGASAVSIQSGAAGTISIGTANTANTVTIGSTTLSSGTQTINIGTNNTAGGSQNINIGSGTTATAGTTAIQSKDTTTFTTNGTLRASFASGSNTLFVGNGTGASGQAATANAFAIQGTSSTGASVQGGALTLQSGAATSGNANGGNLNLTGGAGVGTGAAGLVIFNTPTFQTSATDGNCYTSGALVAASCTFTAASVNGSSAMIAGFSTGAQIATLPDPTITTAGRVIYVTAANNSEDFTLRANAGGGAGIEQNIAMRKNTTATMIWNGSDWTAAGASSSTTLQAAYDNTLQSAGGAELVVSSTAATRGLTIRDSATSPVNGTLLSVQTNSAASLISVNGNVTEYASNSGAETYGGTTTTFPATTWVALGSSTVTRNITTSNIATGQGSAQVATTTAANDGVKNVLNTSLTASQHYNVSFTAKLSTGTFTDLAVYYSIDGTANSVTCATGQAVKTSVWTKVNCAFDAPAAGITANNSINIRQVGSGTARTVYIDNISVTIAADYNYATDGTVGDAGNFATNWSTAALGTVAVTRNTSDGQEASDSAQAAISVGAANAGLRNDLAINPLPSTLYRVSVYAKQSSGAAFTDFKVRYSRNNGTNFVDCVDYNTQTVTTTGWTQITCYITTDATAATSPYVYFVETASAVRTYMVDTFSMTLASVSTPNVQIGGGVNGGPTTLFTLDKGASAPIAANNDALLGSMYYDTTLGKLQCYEADGWGACGSSPDNIVTISPEYTNAVMHGTGVGTMTSDICSDTLNLNDGSSGQPTICAANETYNFYKWTSPQATTQTYGIYVTYQLPTTFKEFSSGSTSLMGRTDSANSAVTYQIYRSDAAGLTACGSAVAVSTGVQSTWQTGVAAGAADPSTCGFSGGDSVVFKINVTSNTNANAYVGNLGFTYSNT